MKYDFQHFLEQRDNELIFESKQELVNLGYPPLIAKMFYQKFGKNAYLLGKWYRDYKSNEETDNWFNYVHNDFRTTSLPDLIALYQSTDSSENYIQTLKKLDISSDEEDEYGEYELRDQREALESQIEDKMFSEIFFSYYGIINDIISGKLKNIAPYKDLKFWDAQYKYDQKNIFQDQPPLKSYNNGLRWINIGKKCHLVGNLMKNCGSAGVMSNDADRTMIALFDNENKPHVVVTYSPNEKRISGDEGVASTEVKAKYHRYVLDLAKFLGANFDVDKSKSKLLGLKYNLQGKATGISKVSFDGGPYDNYYTFNIGPQIYYTDSRTAVSKDDIERVRQGIQSGQLNLRNKQSSIIKTVFNHYNQDDLRNMGIQYTLINQL